MKEVLGVGRMVHRANLIKFYSNYIRRFIWEAEKSDYGIYMLVKEEH
jgi:hypothetical protein